MESRPDRAAVVSPLAPARRRAARAKLLATVGCGVAFAAFYSLSRQSYASHPKHRAKPLAAPGSFVGVVHRDLLQGGVVAPAEAPPEAQTSTS